ncbi:hypothetical protein D9Q98_008133 [Chlorella vulgaris]|uniref:Dihydrolipoamide acetyltransferase component of pyruvate dehydrogenase complex n=1 Tax=Chlorella vulgaris TaxID=3077 RepID=A0A9D4TG24_CHLVU|nr:hypothetical protein D9Q98_008133 [Chlorella vulgaris]
MRRAARLTRLLSEFVGSQEAGRSLPAPLSRYVAASAYAASQQAAAPCRSAWATSGSVARQTRSPGARAFVTAPALDEGPLRQFRLAQTGEGLKEAELIRWCVEEGGQAVAFEPLCELQFDKAAQEISSPYTGTVKRLHHSPGDVVQVGDLLVDIEVCGEDMELLSPPAETSQEAAAAATHHSGAAEHAPGTGRRQQLHPGTSGSIGEDEVADRVLTSPAVRRIARENRIALEKVVGSGPDGRVTKGDILAYLDALNAAGPGTIAEDLAQAVPTTEEATVSDMPLAGAHIAQAAPHRPLQPGCAESAAAAKAAAALVMAPLVVPLRGYRKAMVKSMTIAGQVPHFHYCDEVQMDALVELRQRLKADHALQGTKLTYMPFFLKAAALALREYPAVNSSLSPDQTSLLQHARCNLGVAMATPHGLAVPNIKDVQDKTVLQLAGELRRLQEAAAANRLATADVTGGTFSISNIGAIGGTYATPLVNPPEVAIMAVGSIQRLPRFAADGKTVVPASIINLSLGADHRVVDGATLASFARAWRHYIESPGMLLLHMK